MLMAALFLILGSSLGVPAFSAVEDIFHDICLETQYGSKGFLALISAEYSTQISSVSSILNESIPTIIKAACTSVNDTCIGYGSLCTPPCNSQTFLTFLNETVNDAGVNRTVQQCATSCTTSNLQSLTSGYLNATIGYDTIPFIESLLAQISLGFGDPTTVSTINQLYCGNAVMNALIILWAACGVYMIGAVLVVLTVVLIEKKWALI